MSAPKIFLSHAWADRKRAWEIAQYLESKGAQVWVERAEENALEISKPMVQAVDSASFLVILASQTYVDKINAFNGKRTDRCELEFFYAMGRAKLARSNFAYVVLDEPAASAARLPQAASKLKLYLGSTCHVYQAIGEAKQGAALDALLGDINLIARAPGSSTASLPITAASVDIPGAKDGKRMPDGSTIILDQEGGHLSILPTGVKIRQYGDGSKRQVNVNGTIIDTNADETLVVQTNPDGTRHETNDQGQVTSWLADGTILREFGSGGETRQDGPDGTSIARYADGRKVQTDWQSQMESTEHADGSMDQVDDANHSRLHISKDGKITT